MRGFTVTFEHYGHDAAIRGEADEAGFICQDTSLRNALRDLGESDSASAGNVECVEANESPMQAPRWVRLLRTADFRTGRYESRSLHIPEHVTPASRRRIARLCGVEG